MTRGGARPRAGRPPGRPRRLEVVLRPGDARALEALAARLGRPLEKVVSGLLAEQCRALRRLGALESKGNQPENAEALEQATRRSRRR